MKVLALVVAALAVLAAGCGSGNGDSNGGAAVQGFDRAFIDAMVPHHREAIEMARAAKARGLMEPELDKIADDIIAAQEREIDTMLTWREQWFGSRTLGPIRPDVLGVPESDLGMKHGSGDEIAGAMDVDATFAAMMIAHHEGAIAMAKAAQTSAQHQELLDLADAIIEAQEREIETMRKHAGGTMDHS